MAILPHALSATLSAAAPALDRMTARAALCPGLSGATGQND
jgi:hypothetical protein